MVPKPSSTNAAVLMPSYSSTAPNEGISGQSRAGGGGDDGLTNSGAGDVELAGSAGNPNLVGVSAASSSFGSAVDTSRSGRALLSESARAQHSSSQLPSALASVSTSASRAPTPALAPALASAPVAGVGPSGMLDPAASTASVEEGRSSRGGGERRQKDKKEESVEGEEEEEEKTAAAVIGEILGRLPLSKLKIVIGTFSFVSCSVRWGRWDDPVMGRGLSPFHPAVYCVAPEIAVFSSY